MKFSDILIKALEEQVRSKAWLAKKTGISPQAIGDYCRGNYVPSIDKAVLIADVLGIDPSKIYGVKEVIKHSIAREKEEQVRTIVLGKEKFVELHLFPGSHALLAGLKQSQNGLAIDYTMAKTTHPIPEAQYKEGMFAVKIDQACDCDEDYGIAFGVPWGGRIEEGKPILFTSDPPDKLVIRRVLIHEEGRFIFKEPYQNSNSIRESEIIVIAALRYRLESL